MRSAEARPARDRRARRRRLGWVRRAPTRRRVDGRRVPVAVTLALVLTLPLASACRGLGKSPNAAAPTATAERLTGGPLAAPTGAHVDTLHRDGQTFITFTEAPALRGERYAVYRSPAPLTPEALAHPDAALRIALVGKGSGRAYTDRTAGNDGRLAQRFLDRWVVDPKAGQLPENTGLLVFTVHPDDPSGPAYYGVTLVGPDATQAEVPLGVSGPVTESVAPPRAVRALTGADGRGHVYVQYMDLRRWNPTFHAPHPGNHLLDLPADTPGLADYPAYAYTYLVSEPDPKSCGGVVPTKLPTILLLHGWGGGAYREPPAATPYYCALQVTPSDFGETWYFGFAQHHDYRKPGPVEAGDVIENYTEQRLLRMVSDLSHDPVLGPSFDPQRLYVWGHSMGGGGTIALTLRYPQVFAAGYASQPITAPAEAGRWIEDMAPKFGRPDLKLPVHLNAPEGWAAPLSKYEGTPVYDWQTHGKQFAARLAEETAPLGISHSRQDPVLPWPTQGRPLYAPLDASRRPWAAVLTETDHRWAQFQGLPAPLAEDRSLAPFHGFTVVKDETVPAFSASAHNPPLPPPDAGETPRYNVDLDWSASWSNWHQPPTDEPKRWCMSLRTLAATPARVDVTPRRTQHFHPVPGTHLYATVTPVTATKVAPQGLADVTVGPEGLSTVPQLEIPPGGVRLCLDAP